MRNLFIFSIAFFLTALAVCFCSPLRNLIGFKDIPFSVANHKDSIDESIQKSPENAKGRIGYEMARFADPSTGLIPDGIRKKELQYAKQLPIRASNKVNDVWRSAGPYNVGGRTRALAIDHLNEQIILAGGVTGGIYKSIDGGMSFAKKSTPDQTVGVTCIAQVRNPGFENIWYYGTGESYGVVSAASFSNLTAGNGIYRSLDSGESWSLIEATATNTPNNYQDGDFDIVNRIVTDPINSVVVLAATNGGIFYSDNFGELWENTLDTGSNPSSQVYTDIVVGNNGVMYATVSSPAPNRGLFRSENGINWVEITPANWPSAFFRTVMAINPCNENEVYFFANVSNSSSDEHKFFKYEYLSGTGAGAGGLWTDRSENLPSCSCTGFYTFEFCSMNTQGDYNMALTVMPDCEGILIGGTNIYRAPDALATPDWTWIGGYYCDNETPSNYVYPNHHPDIHLLLRSPNNPNRIYTGSDGGIHYTDAVLADEVEWTSMNNGYFTTQFYTVSIEQGEVENDIIIGGLQDNGTLFTQEGNSNSNWSKIMYGDGAYAAIEPGRAHYYLSWQTGKTFKCSVSDDGEFLGMERIDPGGSNTAYNFINPFILDPNDPTRMYLLKGNKLYRRDRLDTIPITGNEYDPDTHWIEVPGSAVSSGNLLSGGSITCLTINPAQPNTVYYGTDFGRLYKMENANQDSIAIRTELTNGAMGSGYISSISYNEFNSEELLVSISNYNVKSLFYSADGGINWIDVGGNLEQNNNGTGNGPSVIWVTIRENTVGEKSYYAGTSVGLFTTDVLDGNNTVWSLVSADLIGYNIINMMAYRPYDDKLVVATHGNGVFHNKPIATGINQLNDEPAIEIQLTNPVNNDLEMRIMGHQNKKYELSIFNINGQKLWHTTNFTSYFSASGVFKSLPNAIYYLRFKQGNQEITKKILVAH